VAAPRVEDYLLVECAKWRGQLNLFIAVSEGFDEVRHFDAQLDALVEIGALSLDEAGWWRSEFTATPRSRSQEVEVEKGVRALVGSYLESLLGRDGGSRRLEMALELVGELRLLPEAELDGWFERAFEDEAVDEDEAFEDEEDLAAFVGRQLVSVLPGPSPTERDGMRVNCVELYDDGILVRWSDRGEEDDLDQMLHVEVEISDDLGTEYGTDGGGSSGGGPGARVRGHMTFTPAMPKAATRLYLDLGGRRVELAVAP
jgi:hypothetical protein